METFVIRLWTPDGDESDSPLCGVVEHVRGERRPFEGDGALLAFLRACLDASRSRTPIQQRREACSHDSQP